MNQAASYTHIEKEGETAGLWASMCRYRYALHNLVLKDFRVRYRNMSLGVLWSVINPLVMLGVLLIVFTYIHPNRHIHHFPVFLLIGLVFYSFISMVLPPATTAIVANAALVKKVIFPRLLIPVGVVFSQIIHLGIMVGMLAVFMVIFSVPFEWTWLWLLPVLLIMLVFVTGVSLACSALAVFYRDMLYVVESGLKVAFWLTPVFYDLYQVKLNLPQPLYWVYLMNPAAGCIDAVRKSMLMGQSPDPESLGFALCSSIAILLLGLYLFRRNEHSFSDHL